MSPAVRDPTRITVMLDAIREVWAKQPDLRFGQIVVTAAEDIVPHSGTPASMSYLFNVEDDTLLAAIEKRHGGGPTQLSLFLPGGPEGFSTK
jgi:hypothetical protein